MSITALDYLHLEVVSSIEWIENYIHRVGLDSISKFTVIARDPENDEMFIIVTNDNTAELISLLERKAND